MADLAGTENQKEGQKIAKRTTNQTHPERDDPKCVPRHGDIPGTAVWCHPLF